MPASKKRKAAERAASPPPTGRKKAKQAGREAAAAKKKRAGLDRQAGREAAAAKKKMANAKAAAQAACLVRHAHRAAVPNLNQAPPRPAGGPWAARAPPQPPNPMRLRRCVSEGHEPEIEANAVAAEATLIEAQHGALVSEEGVWAQRAGQQAQQAQAFYDLPVAGHAELAAVFFLVYLMSEAGLWELKLAVLAAIIGYVALIQDSVLRWAALSLQGAPGPVPLRRPRSYSGERDGANRELAAGLEQYDRVMAEENPPDAQE